MLCRCVDRPAQQSATNHYLENATVPDASTIWIGVVDRVVVGVVVPVEVKRIACRCSYWINA
jgi:hypothetical protein